ncbi:MAG: hypothetical protein ACTTKW_04395 [Schwartzia sp. (in: firmicutes)]
MSFKKNSPPNLPPVETVDAAILCARIFSPAASTNFTRNPTFAALFSLVLSEVIAYGESTASCRKIAQASNHILLTFPADRAGIRSAYAAAQTITAICRKGPRPLKGAALPLQAALSADCGTLHYNAAYAGHHLFGDCIWLGEVRERALLLAKAAGTQYFPDCLFTHAIHRRLPKSLQEKFPQKYYHDHICCYGEVTPRRAASYGTYSESCGIARLV